MSNLEGGIVNTPENGIDSKNVLFFEASQLPLKRTQTPYQTESRSAQGPIILMGGGVKMSNSIFSYISDMVEKSISVVTAGTTIPEERFEEMADALYRMGVLHIFHIKANTSEFDRKRMLGLSRGIYVVGGDQRRLAANSRSNRLGEDVRMHNLYGGVFVGTSAGASIAGSKMPVGHGNISNGWGLVRGYVDQHLDERNRLPRMLNAVDRVGKGIAPDRNTACVIQSGQITGVIGEGSVHVVWRDRRNLSKALFVASIK